MAKRTSFEVVKQEAWEEAGVKGGVWKKSLGAYEYGKGLATEKGQRTLRWLSPAEAAEAVDEPNLKRLLGIVPEELSRMLRRDSRHGLNKSPFVTSSIIAPYAARF
jgi:8-oxo-dGTP pyrophosphatase MutT (NUDIX family)